MSDEDPPDDLPSEEPPEPTHTGRFRDSAKEAVRSRLESVIPEIIKRAVEIGVEKARESPDNLKQLIHDMKLPREVAHYLFQQVDDTKNGLFRVVAKEMRDFLEHTNFSGELQKLLTTVQFEVNTTIRFTPNDTRDERPKKDKDGDEGASREDASADSKGNKDGDGEDGERSERSSDRPSRNPLPKPEVKTSVHVRRDGGSR